MPQRCKSRSMISMQTIFKFSLVIIVQFLALIYFPSDAPADEHVCWIEATDEKTWVYVSELDAEGAEQTRIWEGWIEQDQSQKIVSSRGHISYDYRQASDDRTYGDNPADCDNGNTITIP
jgi:hypothetical protein